MSCSRTSLSAQEDLTSPWKHRRRASTYNEAHLERTIQTMSSPKMPRKRSFSFHEQSSCRASEQNDGRRRCHDRSGGPQSGQLITLPPPCTCPYFGEPSKRPPPAGEIVIVSGDTIKPIVGAKNAEVSLLGDAARTPVVPGRHLEIGPPTTGDHTVRPPIGGRSLETGTLLGRNNSARSAEGAARGYDHQLTLANSVVTWRGGRRGSSLGELA